MDYMHWSEIPDIKVQFLGAPQKNKKNEKSKSVHNDSNSNGAVAQKFSIRKK